MTRQVGSKRPVRRASPALAAGGFSLLELLVGLVLVAISALAAVPMFVQAMHGNAASRDLAWVGVETERRLELLRETPFDNLVPGGSLTSDVTGYSDEPQPGIAVRWEITDNSAVIPKTLLITVRASKGRLGPGASGDITLTTLRGD